MHYKRNTLNINSALTDFINKKDKPSAVILVGASEASADFIEFSHPLSPKTAFYCLSFTGVTALSARLKNSSAKVYISQVLPQGRARDNLFSTIFSKPEIVEYTQSIFEFNEISEEGYMATALLMAAMRTISQVINGDSLREALLRIEQRLNPKEPSLDQQMLDEVWLVELGKSKSKSNDDSK